MVEKILGLPLSTSIKTLNLTGVEAESFDFAIFSLTIYDLSV
jgi:hypothetical protein